MWKCPINEVYYRAIRKLLDSHALPYIARWRHVRTMSRYIRLCLPAKLLRYGPSNRIRLSRPSFRDTRRRQYGRLRSRNNNHYPRSTPKQKIRIFVKNPLTNLILANNLSCKSLGKNNRKFIVNFYLQK